MLTSFLVFFSDFPGKSNRLVGSFPRPASPQGMRLPVCLYVCMCVGRMI